MNGILEHVSINTIYYSGINFVVSMLIIMLLLDWKEFQRMRVVMGLSQLIWTIITAICLNAEPIFSAHSWGLSLTLFNIYFLITPTNVIGILGVIKCGIKHVRLNHRIWRTEFPTRPYPDDLED